MSKRLYGNLWSVNFLPLPILAIPNTKAGAKDFSDGLQWHALDTRLAKYDEEPADKAYAAIEIESTARSQPFIIEGNVEAIVASPELKNATYRMIVTKTRAAGQVILSVVRLLTTSLNEIWQSQSGMSLNYFAVPVKDTYQCN